MYYALIYETVPDHATRRAPYRADHLALVKAFHAEGKLLMAGAFNPVEGSLLVSKGDSPAVAEDFVKLDPYVTAGLVTAWRCREWTVVVGG